MPALSLAPISAALRAPLAMASQIEARPTPKQAQTIGPVARDALGRAARQQHAALIVADASSREQALHHVPVAGIMRGADEQAGLDAVAGKASPRDTRRRRNPCTRRCPRPRPRATRTASARDRHCRRTDRRGRPPPLPAPTTGSAADRAAGATAQSRGTHIRKARSTPASTCSRAGRRTDR